MEPIYTTLYTSKAVRPFSESELNVLLNGARKKNDQIHVTGLLLYVNGHFLQILEGNEEEVKHLIKRIKCDTRHANFNIVGSMNCKQRAFPKWSMGFKRITPELLAEKDAFFNHIVEDKFVPSSIPMYEYIETFMLMARV